MERGEAFIGSAAFFVIAPGTVAGVLPWLITHWHAGEGASSTTTTIGILLIVLSFAALVECFVRFANHGGTPAPVAAPPKLVINGLYKRTRNPMYIAVVCLIFGQALLFASAALIAYGLAVFLVFFLWVYYYEEPTLRHTFAEEYKAYCEHVPRWRPRFIPWRPEDAKSEP
jgi:protein-S-isoprenylcysteine O-methyltransferase Ste14